MDTPVIVEGDGAPFSADIGDFIEIPSGMLWKCVNCGSCCGNVFSASWLDLYITEFVGDLFEGFCKYLDRNNGNRCGRYATRPNACRGYPFVIKKRGDHYVLTIHNKCSGVGKGDEIDIKEKLIEVLKLAEDDLGVEFMVRNHGENDFRLYKLK